MSIWRAAVKCRHCGYLHNSWEFISHYGESVSYDVNKNGVPAICPNCGELSSWQRGASKEIEGHKGWFHQEPSTYIFKPHN